MMWTCLRGGKEKCSDNSSKGLSRVQPLMSFELRTFHNLNSSSEDGIGGDTAPKSDLLVDSNHERLLTFKRLRVLWGKLYPISFFMTFFSLDTVACSSISTKRGLGELRSKQPRLSLPEPTIKSNSVLIGDFLPSLDNSDRSEPADQVEVIVGMPITRE